MKYLDPMPVTCPKCGAQSNIPVKSLLDLTAVCPWCQTSLEEIGCPMRQLSDELFVQFKLLELVMYLEEHLEITIPDESIESQTTWVLFTLKHLETAARLRMPEDNPAAVHEAICRAVRKVEPKAPLYIDFSLPIIQALKPE